MAFKMKYTGNKSFPFKHSEDTAGYSHNEPHPEMSEQGDAVQRAMRDHESKEAAKKTKKEQKAEYKQAKKDWRKGGKVDDKPERTWRNKN